MSSGSFACFAALMPLDPLEEYVCSLAAIGGPPVIVRQVQLFSSCPRGNRPFMSFVEPEVFEAPAVVDAVDLVWKSGVLCCGRPR